MGLFDFFKKKQFADATTTETTEINKDLFIDDSEPVNSRLSPQQGIEAIYNFLQEDFEARGYNDALTNPDDSYKSDNVKLIAQDLNILIKKVSTSYDDRMKDIDFHILSRGRAGLVDLVEELKTKREVMLDHINKIREIKSDNDQQTGTTQRVMLSYQRGFMRGLAALTNSKIFQNDNL